MKHFEVLRRPGRETTQRCKARRSEYVSFRSHSFSERSLGAGRNRAILLESRFNDFDSQAVNTRINGPNDFPNVATTALTGSLLPSMFAPERSHMQVGISQIISGGVPLPDFLEQSARAGYEVVELSMTRDGDLTPQTKGRDLEAISRLASDHGLSMVSMTHSHCTGNLLDSGPAQRTSIGETLQGLETAAALGIQCTLHTLGRFTADLYYDDAYRNGVAALQELGARGEALDVRIAVEFVWNGFLFSPMEMRRFLDDIGSSHVGFYFDPGNMAVYQFPHHWVRIVGDKTFMVHLKDWKGGPLNGEWTPLTEGEVDFAAMNRELRAIGYDGPMISEVESHLASMDQTADAIRKIIGM